MFTLCLILAAALVVALVLMVAMLAELQHRGRLLAGASAAHQAAEERLDQLAPRRRRLIAVGPVVGETGTKDRAASAYRLGVSPRRFDA